MEARSTKWERKEKIEKESSRKIRTSIRGKIKEIKISKKGLTTDFLCYVMCGKPNFIGVIPQDYLENISIQSYPISLIVNFDNSNKPGSHWVGILITDKTLEIYDSLGFNSKTWSTKPTFLLDFIEKQSVKHTVYSTSALQPADSNLCGLYCIYFLLWRQFYPFSVCTSIFTDNLRLNEKILLQQFGE